MQQRESSILSLRSRITRGRTRDIPITINCSSNKLGQRNKSNNSYRKIQCSRTPASPPRLDRKGKSTCILNLAISFKEVPTTETKMHRVNTRRVQPIKTIRCLARYTKVTPTTLLKILVSKVHTTTPAWRSCCLPLEILSWGLEYP